MVTKNIFINDLKSVIILLGVLLTCVLYNNLYYDNLILGDWTLFCGTQFSFSSSAWRVILNQIKLDWKAQSPNFGSNDVHCMPFVLHFQDLGM